MTDDTPRTEAELACEAFEREMWPEGPAHGSGSGIWAKHKHRILSAAQGCGCTIHADRDEPCPYEPRICLPCERDCWGAQP